MPLVISPQFDRPDISQIAQNMMTAIYGNRDAQTKRDYYQSEMAKNQAEADLYSQKAHRIRTSNAQFDQLPQIGALQAGTDTVDPHQTLGAGLIERDPARLQARRLQAYAGLDSNAEQMANADLTLTAQPFLTSGDPNLIRQGSIMLKNPLKQDEVTSYGEVKDYAQRKSDEAARTENIKGGYDLRKEGMSQAGQTYRFQHTPITTQAGATTTFAPGDIRAPSGSVSGVNTTDTYKAQLTAKIANGTATAADHAALDALNTGKAGKGVGSVLNIGGKGMNDVLIEAFKDRPEFLDMTDPKHPRLSADALASIDPGVREYGYGVAADAAQKSKNITVGADALKKAWGIEPGATLKSGHSWLGPLSGGAVNTNPYIDHGAGAPAPPAGPAAPAGPADPTTIPPAQRTMGMKTTGKNGPLVWGKDADGNVGWLPDTGAQAPAPKAPGRQAAADEAPSAQAASYQTEEPPTTSLAQVVAPQAAFASEGAATAALSDKNPAVVAAARDFLGMTPLATAAPVPVFNDLKTAMLNANNPDGPTRQAAHDFINQSTGVGDVPQMAVPKLAAQRPTQYRTAQQASFVLSNPKRHTAREIQDANAFFANQHGGA